MPVPQSIPDLLNMRPCPNGKNALLTGHSIPGTPPGNLSEAWLRCIKGSWLMYMLSASGINSTDIANLRTQFHPQLRAVNGTPAFKVVDNDYADAIRLIVPNPF